MDDEIKFTKEDVKWKGIPVHTDELDQNPETEKKLTQNPSNQNQAETNETDNRERDRDSRKKVTIIGGGVGGLTLANKLDPTKFHVTIYEKNKECGGRCSSFETGDYKFEQGAILFLFDDIYRKIFSELGTTFKVEASTIESEDHHQVFLGDNNKVKYSSNLKKFAAEIEKLEPGCNAEEKLKKFCDEFKSVQEFVTENVFFKTYDTIWEMLWFGITNFKTITKVFWTVAKYTMYNKICRYFRSDLVCQALTFQSLYFGISPFTSSSLFSILTTYEIATGLKYPKCGMGGIIDALENIAVRREVEIQNNIGVSKIVIGDNKKAIGVTLDDGTFVPSDIVVSNADLTYTYNVLLKGQPEIAQRAAELTSKDYAPSTITFFWGMEDTIEGLKLNNIFLPSDYKKLFEEIHVKRTIPEDPAFFIHIANRVHDYKQRIIPPRESLTVIVPIGEMCTSRTRGSFDNKVENVKKKVIAKLEKILGIQDFESRIEMEIKPETPDSWQDKFNCWEGTILGISHSLKNLLWGRPNQKCSAFPNVYFVGASTQPGAGVPLVMCSGLSLAAKIEKDFPLTDDSTRKDK